MNSDPPPTAGGVGLVIVAAGSGTRLAASLAEEGRRPVLASASDRDHSPAPDAPGADAPDAPGPDGPDSDPPGPDGPGPSALPKALVEVRGAPLVKHCLDRLAAHADHVVVVHPPDLRDVFEAVLAGPPPDRLVPGGTTRSASVRAGVAALPDDLDVVAIHDAVRPFAPAQGLERAVGAVRGGALAAAPAIAVADTVKRVEDGRVLGTIDREGLYLVQTPQVFRRDVLDRVLADGAEADTTDDLALVEQAVARGVLDGEVVVVPGSLGAHKVTVSEDLVIAGAFAAMAEEPVA